MKTWTLRFRVVDKRNFEELRSGIKSVESIDAMFRKIQFKKIMPDLKSKGEAEKRYYSYPNYEKKIKKFGILAFELK